MKSVRVLTDKDSGKAKGFAFVEYFEANSALAAIKHMNDVEINGRRVKVGFPSQSNLKNIAKQTGQDVPDYAHGPIGAPIEVSVQQVVDHMKLADAWDVLEVMKKMITDDRKGKHF